MLHMVFVYINSKQGFLDNPQITVLVGSALYDKHETGLACIAQTKPYKMCMLHGFWVCFAHISSTLEFPKLVKCVTYCCYWQLICYKNTLVG